MLRKFNQSSKSPSWSEVILAAILSAVVGLLLGAAFLVEKPVQTVKAIPKDAPASAVFYIAGATDVNSNDLAAARRAFLSGESVELTEGELNAFFSSVSKPAAAPSPAKPGDKGAPASPSQNGINTGALNARIAEGRLQLADPVDITLFGVSTGVIVQATGAFARDGSLWVFEPEKVLVGGLQVQRIPFLSSFVMKKVVLAQNAPPEVATAWSKLASVSIDGSRLRLRAP